MPNPARPQATAAWLDALSDGPIGVSVARRSGLSTGRIHAAVSANEVVCLRRGIVISRRRWESGDANARHRWAPAAALLAFPEACASHESAARLHGLPDFGLREIDVSGFPEVHITRLGAARKEHWLRVHGCERPPECVVVAGDVPVTNLIRTSIELGAARSLRRSLVFIDSAMRLAIVESAPGVSERAAVLDGARRAWATDQWNEALRTYAGRRWVTHVREAVERADPASESTLESMSRAEIISAGLPRPKCGLPIRGDDGQLYSADMVWERERVIGEADGHGKYAGREDFVREKVRQEAIEAAGWRVVRWGWREGVTEPAIMLRRFTHSGSRRRGVSP